MVLRFLLVLFIAIVLVTHQCHAWIPQSTRTKSFWIAASAAFPVVPWAAVRKAMETTPFDVSSPTMTVSNVEGLQIPILAVYCTMAFWVIPKTVKNMKNSSSSSVSSSSSNET